MKRIGRVVLEVGQEVKIQKSIFSSAVRLRYAGMPSGDRFSVVVEWVNTHNSAAYNLFYEIGTTGFDVRDLGHVTVQEVTPTKMVFVWEPA